MDEPGHYADLELRILARQGDGYPVEMTLDSEQEFGPGSLSAAELPWTPSADPAADGERLFRWLFADAALRAAWGEIRGRHPQRRVRLRIDAEAPELHAVPWELLRDLDAAAPDLAAADSTPFSRYLAGKWQPGHPILKRPLRVLVALADPAGLDEYGLAPLDVEAESETLRKAVDGLDVELTFLPPPCTLAAIEEALKDGYHVLHFFGHGAFDKTAGSAALFLAGDDGKVELAEDEAVAAMLARQLADTDAGRQDKLRLVFLASCQTAERSPAAAFRGLAPRLVAAGVPAVVAMQEPVPIDTARELARVFYRRLLDHGQVDLATNEARSSILTRDLPGAAVPVLFQRLRSGTLLARRGRITRAPEGFWPFLLEKIELGHCVPFLGPKVEAGLVTDGALLAERLAEKYRYPLPDAGGLATVAQFIALTDPALLTRDYLRLLQRSVFRHLDIEPDEEIKRRFHDVGLTDTLFELGWAEKVRELRESEIHHQLADFRLPLYVTTNAGGFMAAALAGQPGVEPRRDGPRWEPRPGSPQYVLDPSPSRERPVVFHLNGSDADEEQQRHLVLSTDDYLSHLVRLARDQSRCLPSNLIDGLSRHSLLFLGYELGDWNLRVLLHGLMKPIAHATGRRVNVAVQLEPIAGVSTEAAVAYLQRYLQQFHLDIYWGTPQEFVTELHERWRLEQGGISEDWS
jgi:hypothetical protein